MVSAAAAAACAVGWAVRRRRRGAPADDSVDRCESELSVATAGAKAKYVAVDV